MSRALKDSDLKLFHLLLHPGQGMVGWLVGIYRIPAEDLVGEYASAIGLR